MMRFRTTGVPFTGAFRAGEFCLGPLVADATVGGRAAHAMIHKLPTTDGPVIRWTPEEVWVMAELARRLLTATIDDRPAISPSEDGAFRVEVHAGEQAIDLAVAIDGEVASLALGARDSARHRWRDGWLLELERGDDRWQLEPGDRVEIRDARRGPIVAHLRVRRRCVLADRDPAEDVPLIDAGFHRYT